ncbi:sulfatase-like hydrolase/transferase [Maioricimonas rarisocia]
MFLLLIAVVASADDRQQAFAAEGTPNVVLIFVDDLGYGDVGCYGATKVKTPNIDRLAKEGRRFTDAHSASAVCTPSRYAMLTGEYPFRQGSNGVWGPQSNSVGFIIDPDKLTLGDVFKTAGYQTACIGKWHLGFGGTPCDWNGPLRPGPLEVGFDYYFGIPLVNSGPPYVYVENDRIVGWDPSDPIVENRRSPSPTPQFPEKSPNKYAGAVAAHKLYDDEKNGTLLTERAVEWIKANHEQPFFLYFSTPNIHHPFTPAPRFHGTSEAGRYGDFIHELDWMVGELLKTLDELKLADDTVVLFTSDNGGMFNDGGKEAWKAGHHINGDLLGFKFGAWEGGHRVPFIVRWPGRVAAGTTSDQLICNVDLLATFAGLFDQPLQPTDAVDSFDIRDAITGEADEPIRESLVLAPRREKNLALRAGRWMYISSQGDGGFGNDRGGPRAVALSGRPNSDITPNGRIRKDAPKAQLYDLEADPAQTTNVLREHPEQAQKMRERLQEIRRSSATRPVSTTKRSEANHNEQPPNFVVIFADDLGYGDISCYGENGVETPHLDALAAEGFRSTDFFVPANVCSPSRASLLTGRYPMRCGVPVARNEGVPKYRNYGLASEEITVPELLEPAGYRSLMVGKWHLGMEVEGSHPLDAGFDEHLGIPSNYSPGRGPNHNTLYRGRKVEKRDVPCEALTKRYTDEVVAFIERQKDRPFFIYVSHHIVHTPLRPSRDFVGISNRGKYGDFIRELDHSTGRIMQALQDAGVDDNTLVVFTSDNGPTRTGLTGGLNGGKYCTMEGGHRVPGIFRWPGVIPPGQVSDVTLTSMDLLPLFCHLAGVDVPTDRTIDGHNILPILIGDQSKSPHELLYYYNGTNLQAVREGDWKLHLPRTVSDQPFWSKRGRGKGFITLEEPALFNLKSDPGERRNVADRHPDVVARLQDRAEAIRAELGDVRVQGTDQREIPLTDPQER